VLFSEAEDCLDELARRFGLPVVETQAGKGTLPWDHPLVLGPLGVNGGSAANALARESDLVLAIGTRLSDFTTASWTAWQNPDVRFVSINVAELDAAKADALPLVADARAAMEELIVALSERGWQGVEPASRDVNDRRRVAWNDEVDRVRHIATPQHVSQMEAIRLVNEAAGDRGIVVCAAGGLPGDLLRLWRTPAAGGYHLEYGYSTMGYEIAGGIGVAMADPSRPVFVMVGDGSYLMLSAEIATAAQEGITLTIVLLDNHGFRCIRNLSGICGGENTFNDFRYRDQATGRLTGDALAIDFAANAASLGATVLSAHDPAGLERALAEAAALSGPVVIVTEIDASIGVEGYDAWWDVPVAEASSSGRVHEARRTYEAHLATQRTR
jgi:3D-(3,5/4)-trihydroxycyclohexane-1,2-dione acylhydrolase (decyclizing)